jgi:hypothetical protein
MAEPLNIGDTVEVIANDCAYTGEIGRVVRGHAVVVRGPAVRVRFPNGEEQTFMRRELRHSQQKLPVEGRDAAHAITLTPAELDLLIAALDSHRYWQLSDEQYRNSGEIIEPGSDDPDDVELIKQTDALEKRLQEIERIANA